MKLRRETGFFNLKSDDEGNFKPILKGLKAEDLIGEIVNVAYTHEGTLTRVVSPIVSARDYPEEVAFDIGNSDEGTPKYFSYDPATGKVIKMGDVPIPESGH